MQHPWINNALQNNYLDLMGFFVQTTVSELLCVDMAITMKLLILLVL